jgi:hypothetical protein
MEIPISAGRPDLAGQIHPQGAGRRPPPPSHGSWGEPPARQNGPQRIQHSTTSPLTDQRATPWSNAPSSSGSPAAPISGMGSWRWPYPTRQ